jgi:hypothetical protein
MVQLVTLVNWRVLGHRAHDEVVLFQSSRLNCCFEVPNKIYLNKNSTLTKYLPKPQNNLQEPEFWSETGNY